MVNTKSIRNLAFWSCISIYLILITETSLAVVDNTFDLGINTIDDVVSTIVIDDQERVMFAGSFSEVAGLPRDNIARVSINGELDLSFAPTIDGPVHSIVKMQSGRLLIVGPFQSVSGTPRKGIAILNEDGSLDTNFAPEFGEREVTHAVVQSDGKVIVSVGKQPYLDNTCCTSVVNPQRLVRLNSDGAEDASFDEDATVGFVNALAVLNSDHLLVSNQKTELVSYESEALGLANPRLAKFAADGASLNVINLDGPINRFRAFANNQFIAVGCFSRIGFEYTNCDRTGCQITGGIEKSKLARFGDDLSVDLSFNVNNDFSDGFPATAACLLDIDQNSKSEFVVVGNTDLQGLFSKPRTVAKVSPLGNNVADFDIGITPFEAKVIKFQSNDKILIGQKVSNLFGQELVGGIIRVFENPTTCFPIKGGTGNISIFCL